MCICSGIFLWIRPFLPSFRTVCFLPPLVLIVFSGVAIGNLALGNANSLGVLLYGSAAFNANVVSTGFVLGYVVQGLSKLKRK